ncbi:MAG: SDR family NAD(P)-dependent oxidoreductase [Ardenticatenia bacterium]|nr:SDR family NAD(P)-dependent oxidoreductase [Ardenticatenia bacterium]
MARQTAFITGVEGGLGRAVALALLQRGWHLVAVVRRGPGAGPVVEELRQAGGAVYPLTANVTRRAELEHALEPIHRLGGTLRLLLPAAEVAHQAPFAEMNPRHWQEMIDVNLTGLFHTVQAALPLMESGSHIFLPMSVANGRQGSPSWAIYSATKAALRGFADALRDELRPRRIHVTLLSVGGTKQSQHMPGQHGFHPDHIAPWILHVVEHPEVSVEEVHIFPLASGPEDHSL